MVVVLMVMVLMMGFVMGFVVGVVRFAFVVDIGNVAAIAVGIGYVLDSLDATIRQVDLVIARHHLAVRLFVLTEVGMMVVVVDVVVEVVGLGMVVVVAAVVMVRVMIFVVFRLDANQDRCHDNSQECWSHHRIC